MGSQNDRKSDQNSEQNSSSQNKSKFLNFVSQGIGITENRINAEAIRSEREVDRDDTLGLSPSQKIQIARCLRKSPQMGQHPFLSKDYFRSLANISTNTPARTNHDNHN